MVASGLVIALFLYLWILLLIADRQRDKGYLRSLLFLVIGGFGVAYGVTYIYHFLWPDLSAAAAGLLVALVILWVTRKITSRGMKLALLLIFWGGALVGGLIEGWEGKRNYVQNYFENRRLAELEEVVAIKRAVRDSIDRVNSRSRDSLIAASWKVYKTVRYEDTFNPADESYKTLEIERNSVTGEFRVSRLLIAADTIFSKRIELLKEIALGMERHWRQPVERDSFFVVTADGDRQFIGIDSPNERQQSALRAVCNSKVHFNSGDGKFTYTEYEACLRTASIQKVHFTAMELCGTTTAQLFSNPEKLYQFPRPAGCSPEAVQSP